MDSTLIVNLLTPIVVPIFIAAFKKISSKIPKWVLPALAPILGVLVTVISNSALQANGNLLVAAALGLAGVGVREIIDQLKPEPKPKD